MTGYTPKTEEVRNCYVDSVESHVEATNRKDLLTEFDRWLKQIQEAAYSEGYGDGQDSMWMG